VLISLVLITSSLISLGLTIFDLGITSIDRSWLVIVFGSLVVLLRGILLLVADDESEIVSLLQAIVVLGVSLLRLLFINDIGNFCSRIIERTTGIDL
jgi:hypothetical protein